MRPPQQRKCIRFLVKRASVGTFPSHDYNRCWSAQGNKTKGTELLGGGEREERRLSPPTEGYKGDRFMPHHPALLIKFPELRLKLTARKV